MNKKKQDQPALDPEILKSLPSEIDTSDWQPVKLTSLHMENFGRYKDATFDFTDGKGKSQGISCLIGPNGTGKTTALNAVQVLFNNYTMYDQERYEANMTKYVRNVFRMTAKQAAESDFLIRGVFVSGSRTYEVEVTKKQVLQWHPEDISAQLVNHCYFARFDNELRTFQLNRSRWEHFRKLFYSVTGFEIEETKNIFDDSSDLRLRRLHEEYVTNFEILNKAQDVFTNRWMSAGERKITKCFSTIYNLRVQPSIILIDNITDHVELRRHLPLMSAMEECFPDSQLIVTCHSAPVQRNFDKDKVYDMRFFGAPQELLENPWKVRMMDEVNDVIEKIQYSATVTEADKQAIIIEGKSLLDALMGTRKDDEHRAVLFQNIKDFIVRIYNNYVINDLMIHPPLKVKGT